MVTNQTNKNQTNQTPNSSNASNNNIPVAATMRTYTNAYNDNTAAIYEEWNVIKKNKFGIKQERVFGIDSKGIYNAKRSDKSDRNNVRLAQRSLNDIIHFEKVDASNSFRITWQEDNIQYVIEYSCENERDRNQILNKLQFLMNKQKKQQK